MQRPAPLLEGGAGFEPAAHPPVLSGAHPHVLPARSAATDGGVNYLRFSRPLMYSSAHIPGQRCLTDLPVYQLEIPFHRINTLIPGDLHDFLNRQHIVIRKSVVQNFQVFPVVFLFPGHCFRLPLNDSCISPPALVEFSGREVIS